MTDNENPSDHDLLLRIDTKMDLVISCQGDHEIRLRALERWQWKATGITAGVSALIGSVMGVLIGKGGS